MAETQTPKRGKTNGYNSIKLHMKKDRKRSEAEVRQEEYNSLTVKERIKRAKSRRGESKKELARLEKLLTVQKAEVKKEEEKKPVVVKAKKAVRKPKSS